MSGIHITALPNISPNHPGTSLSLYCSLISWASNQSNQLWCHAEFIEEGNSWLYFYVDCPTTTSYTLILFCLVEYFLEHKTIYYPWDMSRLVWNAFFTTQRINSVSYTHLDVYKRQVILWIFKAKSSPHVYIWNVRSNHGNLFHRYPRDEERWRRRLAPRDKRGRHFWKRYQ